MKVAIRVFALILAVSFCSSHAIAKEKQALSIIAFDALTEMNKPVDLHCKVEKKNLMRGDLRNANVTISVNGTQIAKVITDKQGVARKSYTPKELGVYTVVFECEEGPDNSKATATSLLFCRDKTKPAILIDIDHTIADIAMEKFLVTRTKDIKPLPGAREVLDDLAKTYDLIFLTARDKHLLHRTKEWLSINHFPSAPVFFRDMGKEPLSESKFKTDKIAQIKASWSNVTYGIGDKLSDAQAYLANGLKTIIISPKEDLPRQAHSVQQWQQIKALLKDLPLGQNSKENR
jgi:phosphatidate phosphatase APP1